VKVDLWAMGKFEAGDYVKVEFKDEASGESEWMWVRVQRSDDAQAILFGNLDNDPMVNTDLRVGMELAISYELVREHLKDSSFNQ
jgi:Uncharacterized protein conserved in bacteria (DUF2314)